MKRRQAKRITPESYAATGSEHAEQVALFIWANDNKHIYPELTSMFAIPNGGKRDKSVAGRLKAEGVKAGVSDIFLPYPNGAYAGLFIEMKPLSKRNLTNEQSEFIALMRERQYAATMCRGWIRARDVLIGYLTLQGNSMFVSDDY